MSSSSAQRQVSDPPKLPWLQCAWVTASGSDCSSVGLNHMYVLGIQQLYILCERNMQLMVKQVKVPAVI